jgi:hypothetical protein
MRISVEMLVSTMATKDFEFIVGKNRSQNAHIYGDDFIFYDWHEVDCK